MFAPLSVLARYYSDYESRFQYEWSPYLPHAVPQSYRPKVLVVGYGYGASAFTQHLDRSKYDTTIVSTSLNRLNQPFLIQNIGLSQSRQSRLYKDHPYRIQIREDTCVSIDPKTNTIHGNRQPYPYDYLVLATGSEVNDFGVKGVKDHCLLLKTKRDLDQLNAKLQQTSIANVIVLGAGPTGIELACKMRSLNYPVTIVEASPSILPGFSQPFRDRVMSLLQHKDIRLRLDMPVSSIDTAAIQSANTNQTLTYQPTDLLLWTCGVKTTGLGLPYKPNQHLSVSSHIYVIGDASRQGPPTAQNAKQQGQYLARVFNSNFTDPPPYKYQELGKVLDTTDGYLIEFKGFLVYVPYFLRPLVDYFRE